MRSEALPQPLLDVSTPAARLDTVVGGDELAVDFSVTNVGAAGVVAAVRPKFDRGPHPDWFRIEGPSDHDLDPGASQSYRLRVKVPAGAEPLDYRISLQAYAPGHPGETYFSGPWVWLCARTADTAPAPPLPGVPLPVAAAVVLGMLAAAAGLALLIDPGAGRAPAVWLPNAWLAGAISLLQSLAVAAALWLLLGQAPPAPGPARAPPSWYVLASTVPTLVALCGALLWARAGWPWLVPSVVLELILAWVTVARALVRRAAGDTDGGPAAGLAAMPAGGPAAVPAWWFVCGVGALALVLAAAAIGIHEAGPGAAPVAAGDGACPPGDVCTDAAAAAPGPLTVALVTTVLVVPLLALVALSLGWLLRGGGPGTLGSLLVGLTASAVLLAVVAAAGWWWFEAAALAGVIVLGLLLAIGFIVVTVKPELRLFAIVLAVLVFLYLTGASFSLKNESGDMEAAMEETRQLVADAREKIRKEMDKPFILRLFGSLFGMEGNSFQKLKERLPEVLKSAMPKFTADVSLSSPVVGLACEGMRLVDALLYLRERQTELAGIRWAFDDEVLEERYVHVGGTVLKATLDDDGAATLVIQMSHGYAEEKGLGDDDETRKEALASLAASARALAAVPVPLETWLRKENAKKLRQLEKQWPALASWRTRAVAHDE